MSKFILTALALLLSTSAYACTLPKSYYKNVSCTARAGVFLAVKDNGTPVALLNSKGQKMVDLFAYQAALGSEFKSGLLPVQKNGKVGYINDKGRVVIGFKFERLSGSRWARGVSDERIIIKQNGGMGVIDTRGNVIVKPDKQIVEISDFNGGIASVMSRAGRHQIDKAGKKITTSQNLDAPMDIPNSLSAMPLATQNTSFIPHQQDGKWGFVDSAGTPMIVYAFDEVKPYSEGLAAVRMADNWGFINQAGNLVIDFRFHKDGFVMDSIDVPELSEPLVFNQGKAWIGSLNNGDKLCINTQGINISCQQAQQNKINHDAESMDKPPTN